MSRKQITEILFNQKIIKKALLRILDCRLAKVRHKSRSDKVLLEKLKS